jgi:hypothetical protein
VLRIEEPAPTHRAERKVEPPAAPPITPPPTRGIAGGSTHPPARAPHQARPVPAPEPDVPAIELHAHAHTPVVVQHPIVAPDSEPPVRRRHHETDAQAPQSDPWPTLPDTDDPDDTAAAAAWERRQAHRRDLRAEQRGD